MDVNALCKEHEQIIRNANDALKAAFDREEGGGAEVSAEELKRHEKAMKTADAIELRLRRNASGAAPVLGGIQGGRDRLANAARPQQRKVNHVPLDNGFDSFGAGHGMKGVTQHPDGRGGFVNVV